MFALISDLMAGWQRLIASPHSFYIMASFALAFICILGTSLSNLHAHKRLREDEDK